MVHILGQATLSDEPALDGVRPVKQTRGRRTRDRLLAAGHRLVATRDIDALSVADIARGAHCSVGAFYQRFRDKDAFFRALIAQYLAEGREQTLALDGAYDENEYITAVVTMTMVRFRRYAGLIRAAISKRMEDASVWEPIRRHGHFNADCFINWLAKRKGRPLTVDEDLTVRFAFQVLYGTLNNAILNQPGPIDIEEAAFLIQLERAFRLVLLAKGPAPSLEDHLACRAAT